MISGKRSVSLVVLFACCCSGGWSAPQGRRTGPVRLAGHCLVDDGGPFLGLGASYFTAVWQCKNDRKRLDRELAFLSRKGFNAIRVLSMVGWNPGWAGREIAPVDFTNHDGAKVAAWPDYWRQMRDLVDVAFDRYGIRTEITVFADAQLMPNKAARLEHLRRLLSEVVKGRESKLMLLEVANEGWQNGFPGDQGLADMREFAWYLAQRTKVPVSVSSDHVEPFEKVYRGSASDIATWHFSRDMRPDQGWEPVYDCWKYGDIPGFPPVCSNEPVGPGSSVSSETDPCRLVMAAAFAYVAKLPMYVFHSGAGVRGTEDFEALPGIGGFDSSIKLLPPDLPNWDRNDGKERASPFTAFAGGRANTYWTELPTATDGCIRNAGSRRGDAFVCVPIGIQRDGLKLRAREAMRVVAYDPLTARAFAHASLGAGEDFSLPQGAGAFIIKGTMVRQPSTKRSTSAGRGGVVTSGFSAHQRNHNVKVRPSVH